jgi:hypothetical protein
VSSAIICAQRVLFEGNQGQAVERRMRQVVASAFRIDILTLDPARDVTHKSTERKTPGIPFAPIVGFVFSRTKSINARDLVQGFKREQIVTLGFDTFLSACGGIGYACFFAA